MTRGIGDIDADFNDRGGDEDMQRPGSNRLMGCGYPMSWVICGMTRDWAGVEGKGHLLLSAARSGVVTSKALPCPSLRLDRPMMDREGPFP